MTAIDLSKVPPPDVVQPLNYEVVFAELKASLLALDPSLEQTLALESEPVTKLLQITAYRELLLRQRINEAAHAVMLAYAKGADLDNLGALYNVARLRISAGDDSAIPPVPAVYESDDEFRYRIQLSLDGLSVAGPARAYIYHALSADGNVLDATTDAPRFSHAAIAPALQSQLPPRSIVLQVDYDAGLANPSPGDVVVTLLSRDADGTPSADLLQNVSNALTAEDIRPLTDNPHIRAGNIINYQVQATIYTFSGPDPVVALSTASANLDAYTRQNHRLGRAITLSGLYAALHVAGVQRVELHQPSQDIECSLREAAFCIATDIQHGGTAS